MTETVDGTLDASVAGSRASLGEPPMSWVLTLVGSTQPDVLGRRCVLEPGTSLTFGRGGDLLGPGGLEDRRLSRAHASVELEDAAPLVRDLGSHNGSLVNGVRVESASLAAGDVITLGKTVLLVHRAPARLPHPAPIDDLVGCGRAHVAILEAVHKVAVRSTTILLLGPPGAGKSHLARAIHTHGGRSGRARIVHCASVAEERVFELFDLDPEMATGEGTTILDAIDEAGPALQARLLSVLDAGESSERIMATAQEDLETSGLRPDLIHRLTRWIIHLPPLAARLEDIPLLAQHFVARYLGEARPLHPKLTLALLRHGWPGNIRELEAVIECLCIDRAEAEDGQSALRLTPRVRAMLGHGAPKPPAARAQAPAEPALLVDHEGRWFRVRGQERVELAHRKTLARVFAALVAQRRSAPGVASSMAELLAAGWPEERVLERAGANRVHVALTTLRKLGLREWLLRRDEGYLIDPEADVRVSDSAA
jgi:hypothetical protein